MNDFNSARWENNLAFFKLSRPEIHSLLIEKDPEFRQTVRFESAGSKGTTHVTFFQEGRYFSLHSKMDPFREAERFLEQSAIEKNQNICFLGLGLGYPLMELLKRRERPDWILIIEGDIRAFWAFCHVQDASFLFKTPGLFFLLCPSEERLFSFLQPHGFTIIANGLKLIPFPSCIRFLEKYYHSIRKKIDDFPRWAYASISTQIRAGPIFSGNFFFNIMKMSSAIPFRVFKDEFKNIPAVIVAAGPSLKKNLILLKQIQGRTLILAVDTIFKVLYDHGIQPDFVISTDFTQNAGQYFDFLQEKTPTVLLVDPEVFPGVPEKYPGAVVFYEIEGNSLCGWSRPFLGDYGVLPKGLSVAHTAFSAALYMGSEPVIFLGQDLAFTGGRTHVKGAPHGVNVGPESSLLEIRGWFGPIKTSNNMKVFLDHYEELISASERRVINCTEGGAFIKGCEHKSFREILLTHPFPQNNEIRKRIMSLLDASCGIRNTSGLIDGLKKAQKELDVLASLSGQLQKDAEEVVNALRQNNQGQLKKQFQTFENRTKDLVKFSNVLAMIQDNLFEAVLIKFKKHKHSLNELDSVRNKDEILQMLSDNRKYFGHIERASHTISEQIAKHSVRE
ncbi:MAG: motility associated factor glycosyltransferase family protein [Candidatus Aureabacteria bacterium]|nr:motility associated factor glycosyltransferase family protein [Candidatus Auribacterota bacterium]